MSHKNPLRNFFSRLVGHVISRGASETQSDTKSSVTPFATKAVAHMDMLEPRQMFAAGGQDYGINVNNIKGTNYAPVVHQLRATGVQNIRLWYGPKSWNERGDPWVFQYVRKFAKDGFDITLTVAAPNGSVGTPEQVKGLLQHVVNLPGVKSAVDRWQIGNEPDHAQYWRGSLSQYVNNFLAPASSVLRSAGEPVISAGPSWNPADLKRMIDAGLLKYADYVGYHPYSSSVTALKANLSQVKALVGNKPLVATEWNIRDRKTDASWAAGIREFWPVIKANFQSAYYFGTIKNSSPAGYAAILTPGGSPNGVFYSTWKGLKNDTSTTGNVPASTGTTSTGGVTTGVKAYVGGFKIINATTKQTLSGFSNLTSSQTIKLSSLSTRNIQIVALTNSSTGSVKFGFSGQSSRIENSADFNVFSKAWSARSGSFNLSASAYSSDNAAGTRGNTRNITLKFV
jgi:hypothetical protein